MYSTSLSFRLTILLFTGVLQQGSTWWFIKDLYPFSKCSLRFFSKELKHSSFCNPECYSFTHIFWGGVMSFLIISRHAPWFTSYQEWDILNPSISSLELSWAIFHLKPSLRIIANCGAHKWSNFFIYPFRWDIVSRLLVDTNPILFPVSGRLSPHNLRCIP